MFLEFLNEIAVHFINEFVSHKFQHSFIVLVFNAASNPFITTFEIS